MSIECCFLLTNPAPTNPLTNPPAITDPMAAGSANPPTVTNLLSLLLLQMSLPLPLPLSLPLSSLSCCHCYHVVVVMVFYGTELTSLSTADSYTNLNLEPTDHLTTSIRCFIFAFRLRIPLTRSERSSHRGILR
jgi:hypothetical protein